MLVSTRRMVVSSMGAIALSLLVSSAQAQAVPSAGQSAIAALRQSLPRDTAQAYFAQALDPRPLPGAGGGAYQYFGGSLGKGAIFWSPSTGAQHTFGNLLSYHELLGREQGLGYPRTSPRPLDADGEFGCDPDETLLYQRFVRSAARERPQLAPGDLPLRDEHGRVRGAQAAVLTSPRAYRCAPSEAQRAPCEQETEQREQADWQEVTHRQVLRLGAGAV